MGLRRCLCLAAWAFACGASTADGPDEPGSDPPACVPGASCPPPDRRECFSAQASCSNGTLTGLYGYDCAAYSDRCELGCRSDYPASSSVTAQGIDYSSVVESGHRLCEEYRIERGARRPGDACGTDFDCLPFPPEAPADGAPWPQMMGCVAGVCREQAPETPADFGAPCTPTRPLVAADAYSLSGIVVAGTCEHALCNIRDMVPGDPGRCTMQCSDDSGCPPGSVCTGVTIGTIVDVYHSPGAKVCLDPCITTACGVGVPDAGTTDGGTPSPPGVPDAG
jgi:hypothetical protein